MTYLSPSMTVVANRFGAHEFRGGADLYPNISNETSTTAAPVEFYFRPPGTAGGQDLLFERDVLRSIDGALSSVSNKAAARALPSSVFPTPVGPRKMNDPIGRRGSLRSARERRSARAIPTAARS